MKTNRPYINENSAKKQHGTVIVCIQKDFILHGFASLKLHPLKLVLTTKNLPGLVSNCGWTTNFHPWTDKFAKTVSKLDTVH